MQSHWRESTENSSWNDWRTTENSGDEVSVSRCSCAPDCMCVSVYMHDMCVSVYMHDVCVFVCMYACSLCVCVCLYACMMFVCLCACMLCVSACMHAIMLYVCVYACMRVCVCVCLLVVCVWMSVSKSVCMDEICVCVCIHVVCVCSCTHAVSVCLYAYMVCVHACCVCKPLGRHRALIVCCSCVSLSMVSGCSLRHVCICGWKIRVEVLWSLLKSLRNITQHTHTHIQVLLYGKREGPNSWHMIVIYMLPFGPCSQRCDLKRAARTRSHFHSSEEFVQKICLIILEFSWHRKHFNSTFYMHKCI